MSTIWVNYNTGRGLPKGAANCGITTLRMRLKCKLLEEKTRTKPSHILPWVIPTDRYDSVVAALTLYGVEWEVYDG